MRATKLEMSAFRALASSSDSSDDESDSRGGDAVSESGTEEVHLDVVETGDESEWTPARTRPSVDEDFTCFICSRGFSRKSRAVSIPCAAQCNPEVQIHRYCLNQWRERKATCPLCRAALVVELEATLEVTGQGGDGDRGGTEVDGFFEGVANELDVKAQRALPMRRLGKTNTVKARRQRDYAKAKRSAQREQAKAGTFVGQEDEDDW